LRNRPKLGRLAGCCHPAPLHVAIRSLRAQPIASAGPFGTRCRAPERIATSWSDSSSHNPLGYCLSAWPETGHGPDSARTRFLLRASPHSSFVAELGTVATPPRGTGDICLPRACAPRRGGPHQLRPAFPRLPGRIPVAPSADFSCRRALDCSIKEHGESAACPLGSPPVLPLKLFTDARCEYLGSEAQRTGYSRVVGRPTLRE
jgi:hypothetical protein